MITKLGKGRYVVKSKKGKKLSKPMGKGKAKRRLAEIEYFSKKDGY